MNDDRNRIELIQPVGMYRALTYDHASRVGNLLFVAGQVGRDASGDLVGPFDPVAQARQAFENLRTILEHAGGGFEHVAKVTTYYVDPAEIDAITEIRREYSGDHRPPHTGLVISMLGSPEVRFEVEAVAVIPDGDEQ
ncbi:RidA family protein [soil metagenome]